LSLPTCNIERWKIKHRVDCNYFDNKEVKACNKHCAVNEGICANALLVAPFSGSERSGEVSIINIYLETGDIAM
jgi:hypothetical protein